MAQDSENESLDLDEGGAQSAPFGVSFHRAYAINKSRDVQFSKDPVDNGEGGGEEGGGGITKPKYSVTFAGAYRERTNYLIRFNKDDYVPVDPAIKGIITLKANLRASGGLFVEERTRYPIRGVIGFDKNIYIEATLTPYRVTRVSGTLSFNGLTLSATIAAYTPYYVAGEFTLSSTTSAYGLIGYDDDVFRGLRSEVSHKSLDAVPMGIYTLRDKWRRAAIGTRLITDIFAEGVPFESSLASDFKQMHKRQAETLTDSQDGIPVQSIADSPYLQAVLFREAWDSMFNEAVKLNNISRTIRFRDLVRIRTAYDSLFCEATKVGTELVGSFRYGTPLKMYCSSYWRHAVKIVTIFKRRPVVPPKYEAPTSEDFNLRFNCPYRAKSRKGYFNLHFGLVSCKRPYVIPPQGSYIVENTFSAKRVADGQPFNVLSATVDTDASSWCWTGSFTIPASDLEYVKAVSGQLPLVELNINGDKYVLLVESFNRSRRFNEDTYTVRGRSISALLDEPHSNLISYTNETEISAVQLVQQLVAETVGDTITVLWNDLVSDIGWVLSPESVSISGQSVIKAIASIVEPVGGMVFTHPSQPVIVIKKVYPYAHWENPTVIDHTLSENIVEDMGTSWDRTLSKNGVYVTDPITGDTVKVYRNGTAGEVLDNEINSAILSTHEARVAAGKHSLTMANTAENRSLNFPFLPEMHHLYPCDILCVTNESGEDWGTIFSVSINVSVSDEGFIDVGYAVVVKQFMETGLYG